MTAKKKTIEIDITALNLYLAQRKSSARRGNQIKYTRKMNRKNTSDGWNM